MIRFVIAAGLVFAALAESADAQCVNGRCFRPVAVPQVIARPQYTLPKSVTLEPGFGALSLQFPRPRGEIYDPDRKLGHYRTTVRGKPAYYQDVWYDQQTGKITEVTFEELKATKAKPVQYTQPQAAPQPAGGEQTYQIYRPGPVLYAPLRNTWRVLRGQPRLRRYYPATAPITVRGTPRVGW